VTLFNDDEVVPPDNQQQPAPAASTASSSSERALAMGTERPASRAFEWDRNGIRRFALNAPPKRLIVPRGPGRGGRGRGGARSTSAASPVELASSRWRPHTARSAELNLQTARGQQSQSRPKTARASSGESAAARAQQHLIVGHRLQ
jgi:hypothetical protein